jgi:hypothetical protein
VRYCSDECSRRDWETHKLVCPELKKIGLQKKLFYLAGTGDAKGVKTLLDEGKCHVDTRDEVRKI